ncbi:restriction endonuclease subunit S [Staphylococcus equorum]|uniref:restriction endonuclease subunit S n=1 Tax=Staphylococcus equorum TaxID=246432 RepID=UPI0025523EEC|nr:restriction endonuclease subunit S [Staphylococcus equorum]MDK9844821.1 restriction endonuclease subunit S [Staphylococcus equorum]
MTNEMSNVPELRFPEFDGEWEEKMLGEVTIYKNGGSFENSVKNHGVFNLITLKSVNTEGELINSGKYIDDKSTETLCKGTLVMILSEQAPGLVGMTANITRNNKYVLNQRVAALVPKQGIDSQFLSKLINRNQKYFSVRSAGTKVKNISKGHVENFNFLAPNYTEQQKIGNFFSKLDRQIELEEQKLSLLEEQKKGYMQKIFSQTLRFKDEEDNVYPDWIRTKLINIVTPLKGQDDNITNLPILTISASRGWLNQKERFSQVIAGNSLKKYTQVKKNDLSYNKGNSKVAKYGIVFRLKNEALVPNVYKSFRPNENIDSIFIEKYFHNKTLDKQLRTRITSTARTDGLLNISDQDFYDIKLYIPILQEQTKIADFLNKLDKLIEKQSSKIILLKHRKKGLLQKMFV